MSSVTAGLVAPIECSWSPSQAPAQYFWSRSQAPALQRQSAKPLPLRAPVGGAAVVAVDGTVPRAPPEPASQEGPPMAHAKVGVQLYQQEATIDELRAAWQAADALGVDTMWLWDHFFPLYGDPDANHYEAYTL